MLTLTQTRLKSLLAGLMAVFVFSVLGSLVLSTDSAHAADYPNRWCTFKEASDGKSFTASCTDDKDNGGFHDVVFKSSGKDTFSFTDSFWTTSGVRIPVTSHDKPDGNSATGQAPVETKCKPAAIKVANNEGTISGQYASQTTEGGLARWTCTDLLAGKISLDRGLVRLTAWRDTLYQSLLKSLPPIECERFNKGSNNYNQCASAVAIAVNACVGSNGSVWKETMSYADADEQKDAYKKTAVDCLDGRLSQASRADIRNAVNNAQQTADEEESKIVDTEGGEDEEDVLAETTSCAIDGIGWLVCPVLTFIGKMNDAAFTFLTKFLGIQPAVIMSEATRNAWSAFRDIANVAFVIAFMVIVYSQITSAGISNYGIKKMLPRIVVAAILVNISFYICAIAVDISNIVGASVYSLLKDSIDVGSEIQTTQWENSMSEILGIAATGIGVVLLVVAITMAPAVLLAFVLIILILVARQALVILLIVVSPLAFVAYLLPNTESWFKKWWKAFVTTIMVYPIVGLVFGASTLASSVLVQVSQGGEGDDQQLLMLIALGVAAVPLFAVPAILKGSLSAAGSIGTKIAGLADRSTRMTSSQFGNRTKQYAGGAANAVRRRAMSGQGAFGRKGIKGLYGLGVGGMMRGTAKRNDKYKSLQETADGATDQFLNTNAKSAAYRQQAIVAQQKGTISGNALKNQAMKTFLDSDETLELRAKAKVTEIELDASQKSQDALFTEMTSRSGAQALANAGMQQQAALQISHAAETAHEAAAVQAERGNSAARQVKSEFTDLISNDAGLAATAGGIDENGAMRVIAAAKAAKSKESAEIIQNIQSTVDYNKASDNTELERMFTNAKTTEERVAYAKLMRGNGSPGVEALKRSLSNHTSQNAALPAGPDRDKALAAELDLKEILAYDGDFRSAGRDFEVWANNEQPGKTFREISDDTGVWSDQSAQRFASMSKPAQLKFIAKLSQDNPTELQAFIARFNADPTAAGRVKGAPQEALAAFQNNDQVALADILRNVDKGM